MRLTVPGMLQSAEHVPHAVLGEAGVDWSGAALLELADTIARALAAAGIERHHRVACVTRNGPHAAISFLGSSMVAAAAPLNPAYTQAEFEFSLRDLPARALVTDGSSPAALAAANAAGIPILFLDDITGPHLRGADYRAAQPDDVALVLHTSGTTGTPKRVPLTHANLASSAANIARSLELSSADRCLNVMPLFHIHGLVGCLLASLSTGASVVCTPGFDAFKFSGSLLEFQPTWYSAVPTMHLAILARSRGNQRPVRGLLRFVRSASSSLPEVVARELEDYFCVPAIEAYGMTEASHQIASNPLPPAERRHGSVGLPSGVDVAVFSPEGDALPAGSRGEVGIRGPSVTRGYEGIDAASVTFSGGWLRTGDEGQVDPTGYIWLTGRIKEIINRGGEKVSPAEVEGVLLQHPSVGAAVVFAVRHEALGQDVAAAVVPAGGAPPPEPADLRAFAADRLARFKVPRNILIVDAIPLGPTGKPQRTTMAARLGLE